MFSSAGSVKVSETVPLVPGPWGQLLSPTAGADHHRSGHSCAADSRWTRPLSRTATSAVLLVLLVLLTCVRLWLYPTQVRLSAVGYCLAALVCGLLAFATWVTYAHCRASRRHAATATAAAIATTATRTRNGLVVRTVTNARRAAKPPPLPQGRGGGQHQHQHHFAAEAAVAATGVYPSAVLVVGACLAVWSCYRLLAGLPVGLLYADLAYGGSWTSVRLRLAVVWLVGLNGFFGGVALLVPSDRWARRGLWCVVGVTWLTFVLGGGDIVWGESVAYPRLVAAVHQHTFAQLGLVKYSDHAPPHPTELADATTATQWPEDCRRDRHVHWATDDDDDDDDDDVVVPANDANDANKNATVATGARWRCVDVAALSRGLHAVGETHLTHALLAAGLVGLGATWGLWLKATAAVAVTRRLWTTAAVGACALVVVVILEGSLAYPTRPRVYFAPVRWQGQTTSPWGPPSPAWPAPLCGPLGAAATTQLVTPIVAALAAGVTPALAATDAVTLRLAVMGDDGRLAAWNASRYEALHTTRPSETDHVEWATWTGPAAAGVAAAGPVPAPLHGVVAAQPLCLECPDYNYTLTASLWRGDVSAELLWPLPPSDPSAPLVPLANGSAVAGSVGAYVVTGQVRLRHREDREAPVPVAAVRVTAHVNAGRCPVVVYSDANGQFRLRVPLPPSEAPSHRTALSLHYAGWPDQWLAVAPTDAQVDAVLCD